jgi:hypothetical protein
LLRPRPVATAANRVARASRPVITPTRVSGDSLQG